MTPEEIGRVMGSDFGAAVAQVSGSAWTGPLPSSYGWHLVKVERRVEATAPALSDRSRRRAPRLGGGAAQAPQRGALPAPSRALRGRDPSGRAG